ncbi:MAG: acyl-CoA desaturase [Planctomycetota bacterium]|jgi:stearoyl-CoA desaturase (delta-9 desaturase)
MDSEAPKLSLPFTPSTEEAEGVTVANPADIGRPATTLQRSLTLIAILVPFAALIYSVVRFWQHGIGWTELSLLIVMYLISGYGITIGYHRLFAHRAFETFAPIRAMFAVMGSMAVEGPVVRWVAVHRRHHQFSDQVEDPHSPNQSGKGLRGMTKGLFHAHMGWMFREDYPGLKKYVRDLTEDKLVNFVSRQWTLWAFLGLLIPTVIGGVIQGSWTGAFFGFLWGGLVRIFFVHHVTWSINSVCHIWGKREFDCKDHSKNNAIFGVLGLGEGWHNNHHAFPNSARHGLSWWQFDSSYIIIWIMQKLGLAWRVRIASPKGKQ